MAATARDLPWEESLSGAASGLALAFLDGEPPDPWRARWAALAAGYPYPIVDMAVDRCSAGCSGDRVLNALETTLEPGDDLGLARARGPLGDTWVGLVGRHTLALTEVPRQAVRGADLALKVDPGPAGPDVTVTLVAPDGGLERAPLGEGLGLTFDIGGAWWLQVEDAGGVQAAFPVYVELDPPLSAPLDPHPVPPTSASQATADTWLLLDAARRHLDRAPLEEDPLLAAAARAHLRDRMAPETGPQSGPLAGSADACRMSLACAPGPGEGPEACVRAWLVDPPSRARLTDARCALAGVAATANGTRWAVQVELGAR